MSPKPRRARHDLGSTSILVRPRPEEVSTGMARLEHKPPCVCELITCGVLLALLFIFGTPLSAAAQLSTPSNIVFTAPFRSYGIDDYPDGFEVGDISGDLRPDLVVARRANGTVSLMLASGEGNFTPPRDIDAGPAHHALKLVDLNADGRLDIAVANGSSGTVSILLGRGDGTFLPRVTYQIGGDPHSMAVGDLNGDGALDIVTANRAGSTASVLMGAGDGTFSRKADIPAGRSPDLVTIVDLDSDGRSDLVLSTSGSFSSHSVLLLPGNGDGSFRAGINVESGYGELTAIAAADVSGDGQSDLLICTTSVVALLMNHDGTVASSVVLMTDGFPFTSIAIGDLDGDGIPDVAAANPAGDYSSGVPPRTVAFVRGLGRGTFGPREEILSAAAPVSIAIVDMTGDGHLDVVAACAVSRSMSVMAGNGDGTFGSDRIFATSGSSGSIGVGDFNRDGHVDLVTTDFHTYTASVLLGDGTGRFTAGPAISDGRNPVSVSVSDLNADGILDLIFGTAYSEGDGEMSVFLGNGNGTFHPASTFESGLLPLSIAVADINRDGKLDMAVANGGFFASITVHFGRGDGTFSAPSVLATGTQRDFTSVATGDLNNDGSPDLAFTGESAAVSILLGVGDGTFANRKDIPLPDYPYPSFVGMWDLDHDGNQDLVVEGDSVYVMMGNGDGSFRPKTGFAGGTVPYIAACADFDGDGHLDIVSESWQSRALSVLRGRGDGTFDAQVDFGARGFPSAFPVADFDEDGRPDLAVTSDSGISVMLNRTPGAGARTARAFLREPHRVIPIGAGEPRLCIEIEPVDQPFDLYAVDPSTVTMRSIGTGSTASIVSIPGKRSLVSDVDGNGIADLEVCFAREDLARLFSKMRGKQSVEVSIAGSLTTGIRFLGRLTLTVVSTGRPSRVEVAPNPLNPTGTLTFSTAVAGRVRVTLFDIQGRQIRTLIDVPIAPSGVKHVRIGGPAAPGDRLASGVYFYRIETADGTTTGRFAVLK